MSVRRFVPAEWQLYRALRLAALKDEPDAFLATYAEALEYPDSEWQTRLNVAKNATDFPMCAEWKREPAGLAWARINGDKPAIASLFSVWIAPDYRRRGLAQAILDAAENWAVAQGATELQLEVTCGNVAAESLYRSAGFVDLGEATLRRGTQLFEQLMVKYLSSHGN